MLVLVLLSARADPGLFYSFKLAGEDACGPQTKKHSQKSVAVPFLKDSQRKKAVPG
jgi:hypothetical protein